MFFVGLDPGSSLFPKWRAGSRAACVLGTLQVFQVHLTCFHVVESCFFGKENTLLVKEN